MKLKDVLDNLLALDEDSVIFARRPWSFDSEAEVGYHAEEYRLPEEITSRGFDYFLEVFVAKEVLEDVSEQPLTQDEKAKLLIHYAEYDAYPEWVTQSNRSV